MSTDTPSSVASSTEPGPVWEAWLARAVQVLPVLALYALMLHIVANALSRRLLDTPITSTTEVAQYIYMPVLALIGLALAQRAGEQIEASIVYDRLSDPVKRLYSFLGHAVTLLLALAFAWYGLQEALDMATIKETAGMTSVPIWPIRFVVPVAFLLLAVFAARQLSGVLRGPSGSGTESQEEVTP